jgi:energy-coupling factor transporter ATP-binding protein EcfA2
LFEREESRMDNLIVGLAGPAGAGKSTLAKALSVVLEQEYKFHSYRHAFASPIKSAVSQLFTIPTTTLNHPILKEKPLLDWGLSPRQIMQSFGTQAMRRVFGDDIWIKIASNYITTYLTDAPIVIIDDVRFPNELKWIHQQGGIVLYVRNVRVEFKDKEHESETYAAYMLQSADYVISNSNHTIPPINVMREEQKMLQDIQDKVEYHANR